MSAASDQHLTAITSRAVAHSSDGGANWTMVGAATLPDSEFNSIVADTHIGGRLYLGADIGVFLSEDHGQTWSAFDIGLPNSEIFQIFLEGGHLYAVTHGRGLWRRRIC